MVKKKGDGHSWLFAAILLKRGKHERKTSVHRRDRFRCWFGFDLVVLTQNTLQDIFVLRLKNRGHKGNALGRITERNNRNPFDGAPLAHKCPRVVVGLAAKRAPRIEHDVHRVCYPSLALFDAYHLINGLH